MHIFISYAKKDARELAKTVRDTLSNLAGVTVWMDESLQPGESWAAEIEQEINQADYVIVLVSPDVNRDLTKSMSRSFVLKEIAYAQQMNKTIIPVMAKTTRVPVVIADIHYIDFTKSLDDGMRQLVRRLGHDASTTTIQKAVVKSTAPGRGLGTSGWVIGAVAVILTISVAGLIISRGSGSGNEIATLTLAAGGGGNVPTIAALPRPTDTLLPTIAPTSIPATLTPFAPPPSATPLPTNSISGKIAFSSEFTGNNEIWVINADGSDIHQLTNNAANESYPSWSPDGSSIAFVSNRSGSEQAHLMDANSNYIRQLTFRGCLRTPAWFPDGSLLSIESAKTNNNDPKTSEIYNVDIFGNEMGFVTSNSTFDGYPAWSPLGNQLAFVRDDGGADKIYIMNANGTNAYALTAGPMDYKPVWSPDGSRIVFVAYVSSTNAEVFVMNANGTNIRQLTHHDLIDFGPSWSPDGTKLVFASPRADGTSYELYIMDAQNGDYGNLIRLTNNSVWDGQPSWHS